jgi:hypothetical protein
LRCHLDDTYVASHINSRVSSAIKSRSRNDVITLLSKVNNRIEDGVGSGSNGESRQWIGPFQLRVAGLERVVGWIPETGVDVAQLLESKEVGSMLGILEDKRGGAVKGYCARGPLTCNQGVVRYAVHG